MTEAGAVRPLSAGEIVSTLGFGALLAGRRRPEPALVAAAEAAYERGDYRRARALYRGLAAGGDAEALHRLAILYDFGRGGGQDKARAFKLYWLAAEREHAAAAFDLGYAYEFGDGVSPDPAAAAERYGRAADLGDLRALNSLGRCYLEGVGVAADVAKARALIGKAAEQGHAMAQYNLALLLDSGKGGPVDKAAAIDLFRRAAEGGIDAAAMIYAAKRYSGVTGELTPEQASEELERRAHERRFEEMVLLSERLYEAGAQRRDLVRVYGWAALAAATYVEDEDKDVARALSLMERTRGELGGPGMDAARRFVLEKGDAEAVLIVGHIYQRRLGDGCDAEEGDAWIRFAWENGGEGARYVGSRMFVNVGT